MAYAENETSTRVGGSRPPARPNGAGRRRAAPGRARDRVSEIDEPIGRPYADSSSWGRIGLALGILTAGIAAGAALGVLFAPQSGSATRADVARQTRRLGSRAQDAWDDLRDGLWWARTHQTRDFRRRLSRAGWRAQDTALRVHRGISR